MATDHIDAPKQQPGHDSQTQRPTDSEANHTSLVEGDNSSSSTNAMTTATPSNLPARSMRHSQSCISDFRPHSSMFSSRRAYSSYLGRPPQPKQQPKPNPGKPPPIQQNTHSMSRPMPMREFQKENADLKKEIFDLKLRVYQYEKSMTYLEDIQAVIEENQKLNAQLTNLTEEVDKLQDMLACLRVPPTTFDKATQTSDNISSTTSDKTTQTPDNISSGDSYFTASSSSSDLSSLSDCQSQQSSDQSYKSCNKETFCLFPRKPEKLEDNPANSLQGKQERADSRTMTLS
ncbi:hypothetical protein EC973_008522 [Apophysomyces ossiformis]|uniref:Centrosomin N-terminal motif 1 domain-containing protein n=1 Tax=Apophysomyces ossiformis TaxID=679940 RepID=A0A8H7EP21_9FUNG|nr:hypothetical protein EC973_008522 [Apophysomyces ossiformis]